MSDAMGWRDARDDDHKAWRDRGGGGGKGGFYSNRLKLSSEPIKIHMRRPVAPYKNPKTGKMSTWVKVDRHWLPWLNNGKGGYVVCTGDQCLVDIYSNPQKFGFDMPADVNLAKSRTSGYMVVDGLVEEWFHLVQVPSRKDPSKTYTERMRCSGRHCEGCKDKLPKVFGNRFYHAISWASWRYVFEPVAEELERFCKCGGYIMPVHYACKACNTPLVHMTDCCPGCASEDIAIEADPASERCHMASCNKCGLEWALLEYKDANLRKQVTNEVKCPACGHDDTPKLILNCSEKGCEGKPHTLYDVQLTLQKESDDKNAHLKVVKWAIQDLDGRSFDPAHQGGGEAAEKIAKRNAEPIPLDKIDDFLPLPPHAQAKLLNVKNPFVNQGPGGDDGGVATHESWPTQAPTE